MEKNDGAYNALYDIMQCTAPAYILTCIVFDIRFLSRCFATPTLVLIASE